MLEEYLYTCNGQDLCDVCVSKGSVRIGPLNPLLIAK